MALVTSLALLSSLLENVLTLVLATQVAFVKSPLPHYTSAMLFPVLALSVSLMLLPSASDCCMHVSTLCVKTLLGTQVHIQSYITFMVIAASRRVASTELSASTSQYATASPSNLLPKHWLVATVLPYYNHTSGRMPTRRTCTTVSRPM